MIYSGISWVLGLLLLIAGFKKRKAIDSKAWVADIIFGVLFLVVGLVNAVVISPFKVPSESMLPLLNVGDYVVVQKYGLPRDASNLVGKVVVFKDPLDNSIYVKRIAAGPGQSVTWDGHVLLVDGKEKGIYSPPCSTPPPKKEPIYAFMNEENVKGEWTVSKGLFAVGTNICRSMDSRSYGEIPLDNIIGVVVGVCNEDGCKGFEEANPGQY